MRRNAPSIPEGFLKDLLFSRAVLSRLMLINVSVFVLLVLANLMAWLGGMKGHEQATMSVAERFLALPSYLPELAARPWTLITYMFSQEGFFHLLFNMILLYFGGILFLQYLDEQKLLLTYLAGGLAGAVFFIGAFNLFPVFESINQSAVAIGSSASVLAVFIAIATYVPDYTVHLFLIGKVKLKYVGIAFIVIDLLSIQHGNPGGHIAHIGGALWGFLYAFSLRRGHDLYAWLMPLFNLNRKRQPFSSRKRTARKPDMRHVSDEDYNARKVASHQEIDAILEKISRSGYASLTAREKELLFKTSKKQ